MHFTTLVTLDIPTVEEAIGDDAAIQETLTLLKIAQARLPKDIMRDFLIRHLEGLKTIFARTVNNAVDLLLEPYAEQTENQEYLEFDDRTEDLRDEYEHGCVDCFKLPGGMLVSKYHRLVCNKFCIHDDGKVYQKNFGQLKHDKRSKKAKKMIGLKDYPYKKLCSTFEIFAGDFRGYTYYEKEGGYGYYYNPNAFYDWYQIGGRWADMFLVKDTCLEYSIGERSWTNDGHEFEAPEGYMWVAAARKKDIEWQVMHDWKIKCATDLYSELKEAFETGVMPKNSYWRINGNKIVTFGDILYIAGESLETHLKRIGLRSKFKYPDKFYSYLENGEYHDVDNWITPPKSRKKWHKDERLRKKIWRKQIQRFIDSLPDNTVIVGVDCHI